MLILCMAHPYLAFTFAVFLLYVAQQQFANLLRIYIGWHNDRMAVALKREARVNEEANKDVENAS